MSRFGINTGTVANDGTGSTLREAGEGINANFQEIYNCLGDGTDISLDTSTFALKTELSSFLTSADLTGYAQTNQLFDGNYNSLSNLPTLFNGDYNSLSNLPTLFDGDYNSLTNAPISTTIQISDTDVSNWNTAHGWGDHSGAGYLTSESDDLDSVLTRDATTDKDITTTGKIYYANVFSDIASLPDASVYHGMFAHVHGTGKGYFAHGGNWTELLDENKSIPTLLTRQSKSIQTTLTIVDGETDVAEEILVGKTYILYKIETSAAAWVRLYVDTASRTSDSTRDENTDPQPGSGVIAEVITTGAQEQKMTPGVFGWCESGSNIPLSITNKSGSDQQITVTLTYLVLEG